jgi:putative (di)nucleoside polyphosphate hydrolase
MFRANVAALIRCGTKYVACRRADHNTWQCVQGGIELTDPSPLSAIIREIQEELGVKENDFVVVYQSKIWRRYYFTESVLKEKRFKDNVGQEQLWFLIDLPNFDSIHLENSEGEFSKVKLVELPLFLKSYAPWKHAPFYEFCQELGLA